jgi:hypothetical protein
MALIKKITFDNQTSAEYWKIAGISLDAVRKEAKVTFRGYFDREARDRNVGAYVSLHECHVAIADVSGNVMEQAYEAAKTAVDHTIGPITPPFFEGATEA